MGREMGGRFRMGNTCTPMADSCQCMEKPIQYCKVISLQLNKFISFLENVYFLRKLPLLYCKLNKVIAQWMTEIVSCVSEWFID